MEHQLLSGLLCGLSVLPLEPARPVSSALIVGLTVVVASTLLFDPKGREVLLTKFGLWARGSAMMVIGRDKKWKKKSRPDLVVKAKDRRTKRLVFVRHGESEWNLVFNVGPKILVPVKAILALAREALMVFRLDSVLYDSPLNESGLAQARDLEKAFANYTGPGQSDVSACLGKGPSSVVCCSNLRRALQTIILALRPRLEKDDKVAVLSALQEISTNVDTLSLTPPFKAPLLADVPDVFAKEEKFDVAGNSGNKLLRGNGLQRMQAFAEWAFKRDEDVIIVGGHSLWFRYFFKEFLPKKDNPFNAKDCKISNGGVVALTLERGSVDLEDGPTVQYRVDPNSILEIHIGFDKKKNKSSSKAATTKSKKQA